MNQTESYLMENEQETIRLEAKTDPEAVRKQALWCGVKPGLRILDAGCGPGITTSILREMIQPGGEIVGVDYSEERIRYAREHCSGQRGIDFKLHDLRAPLIDMGTFDLIWVRFFLEYYRVESPIIVRNLTYCLRPGGALCLLDLDNNCLNHYALPKKIEGILGELMALLEKEHNFDPYAGRKLYSYLYDLGYKEIRMELAAHHLIYGENLKAQDIFNWVKKIEVVSLKAKALFEGYPGGAEAFFDEFREFFLDPRRFTYTPLIMCRGVKPGSH